MGTSLARERAGSILQKRLRIAQRLFQHATQQTTPASMSGGDFAAVLGTEQHRHTVGGQYCAGNAALPGIQGIRLR